ncbi:DEAD/DEAH box helicase family protein [Mycolicibacterium wolinskyi]|uniref:DEAD/DEAH box helicase family protein n=1 Tax=Mycolicibacterium wolinskyi TaxID=59750 RepID=UPI00391779C7
MTGNFEFLKAQWPRLYAEARSAERDALFDARTTCFYARRAVEHTVAWLYRMEGIDEAYKSDLAARINKAEFVNLVGHPVRQKLDLIRKLGNVAVHEHKPVPKDKSQVVLRELFHVMSWLARTYGADEASKPDPAAQFNPALLPKPAGQAVAKSIAQITKLNDELKAKDAALEAAAAAKTSLEAELAAARAELAAIKAANQAKPDLHDYDEATTRTEFIDADLLESGWTLTYDRDREFPVQGMPDGKTGYVDYVLWGGDGKPLGLVEAKRTARDAKAGQEQARRYADCLQQMFGQRPIIYYSNGFEHHVWDDLQYPSRPINGFHTRDQLELLIQRRATRKPLVDIAIPPGIVDRPYQERAIRRVLERFEIENQREALLVMATGAGKTRTVIALTDMLARANWVKRVLFLADRVALVKQAANAFKSLLPDSAPVNLLTDKNTDSRVYVATYPTMMGLIDETNGGTRRFGPGYFDLVVIDEAHRSVYRKYRHIFAHFDSLLLGLTATPEEEVDRNTYQLFKLEDGVPTDNYGLDEAIDDGYLVRPRAVVVPLHFPLRGLRYDDLSEEEKDEWDATEWDEEDDDAPDVVAADAVNKWLFNADTVDKALEVLMRHGHRVAGGDRLAKTIIFARNNRHAQFIADRFNANYPEYKGEFARVITHAVEFSQALIDDFSQPAKAPHIAISVDMLDTGIDVPEVANLVFFKPVRSKSKFWQMVGRGTRLCPDLYGPGLDKKDFLIFDICANFEYFGQDLPTADGVVTKPLSERLFAARTEFVGSLDKQRAYPELRADIAHVLVHHVQGMRLDNFIVKPKRAVVEKYSDPKNWESLVEEQIAELIADVAPLPTTVRDSDEPAKRFDLMVVRSQIAVLQDHDYEPHQVRIREIADGLLDQLSIPEIKKREELLREVASDEWWQDITPPMLEQARRQLRSIVGLLEKKKRPFVYADYEDTLGDVTEVAMPALAQFTDIDRFNAKVYDFLVRQPDNLALQKLKKAHPLTETDLQSLQELLLASGVADPADLDRAADTAHGFGRFIRSLIGLDRQAATSAFAEFLDGKTASADQIQFIQLVINYLTRHGSMSPDLLFEPPFTDNAPKGIASVFDSAKARAVIDVIEQLNASADAG